MKNLTDSQIADFIRNPDGGYIPDPNAKADLLDYLAAEAAETELSTCLRPCSHAGCPHPCLLDVGHDGRHDCSSEYGSDHSEGEC